MELSTFLISVYRESRPLLVRQRASLVKEPCTAVVLGEAPDGLPLVLRIERPASIMDPVLNALGFPEWDVLPHGIRGAIDTLEREVQARARRIGIEDLGAGPLYRSGATVGTLLGPTMLARLIGAQSPMILEDDRHAPSSRPEQVANTTAFALSPSQGPITAMKDLDSDPYLIVPLHSGPVFAVQLGAQKEVRAEAMSPLILEDLRQLPSARFHWGSGYVVAGEGELADEPAYRAAVMQGEHLAWSVSVHDLANAIVQLAENLQSFHDEGRAHCDVKPGNTLITSRGAVAIDPLGISFGNVSPAATPGWASPEQILARPVGAQSDVFALGLLVARLVKAAIYGEERSFIIPTGKGSRRRVKLLGNADVFIDPDAGPDAGPALADSVRADYVDFIRRCIAFEPELRPADGAAFAAELRALLDRQPLPGSMPMRGGPGALYHNVDLLGAFQPSWVVTDRR